MVRAITDQTVTVKLPNTPQPEFDRLVHEAAESQLNPGHELIRVRIDSVSFTTLGRDEVLATIIYDYWPADNSGSSEK